MTSHDCNQNGVPDDCDLAPTHLGFRSSGTFPVVDHFRESLTDILIGDFNTDGDNDVVAVVRGVPGEGRVSILLGAGDGTLGNPWITMNRRGLSGVAAADLNGDGKLDLATGAVDFGSVLEVLLGNGDGTFDWLLTKPLAGNAGTTMPADLDGDQDMDLILGGGNGVIILENNGQAAFHEELVRSAYLAITGDFDGDLDADFLARREGVNEPLFFRNGGDATFEEETAVGVFFTWPSLAADFDTDGDLDIFSAPNLFRNLGDGTFDAPVPTGLPHPGTTRVAADFDQDGDIDLVVAPVSLDPFVAGVIGIARNRGDGTFPAADQIRLGVGVSAKVAADLNRDTIPDLVTRLELPENLHVLLGKGASEPASRDLDASRIPDECELDCDRDGLPDAYAIGRGDARDCNRNGIPDACDLQSPVLFEKGESIALKNGLDLGVSVADFDGKSGPDFAFFRRLDFDGDPSPNIFEPDTRLEVFLNDAGGAFFPAGELELDGGVGWPEAADFNGDGLPELLATRGSIRPIHHLFLNAGGGIFEPWREYWGTEYVGAARPLDLNGDGLLDILGEGGLNDAYLGSVLLQLGGMDFSTPRSFTIPGPIVAIADLDGDGAVDLLTNDPWGSIWVSLNDINGDFPQSQSLADGSFLAAADFDGDADIDLVVDDRVQGSWLTLLNRGDATFERGKASPRNAGLFYPIAVDVEADGDLDLVSSVSIGLAIFPGDGKGTFGPPFLSRGTAPWLVGRLVAADFDLDGLSDLAILGHECCFVEVRLNRTPPPTSKDADRDGIPDECAVALVGQLPSDGNQDGALDISDALWLIGRLFEGAAGPWPCADRRDAGPGPADIRLLDANADATLDLSDPIAVLFFLFFPERPPPALGTTCVPVVGCPDRCVL